LKAPSGRELPTQSGEGECVRLGACFVGARLWLTPHPSPKGDTCLAAARAQNGSCIINAIHYRSAASLPTGEGFAEGLASCGLGLALWVIPHGPSWTPVPTIQNTILCGLSHTDRRGRRSLQYRPLYFPGYLTLTVGTAPVYSLTFRLYSLKSARL